MNGEYMREFHVKEKETGVRSREQEAPLDGTSYLRIYVIPRERE